MITIQEALQIIHSQKIKQRKAHLPLIEAPGHCLSETIKSPVDLPSFDNSAMDGYAVCGTGNSFTIIGEIAAGDATSYSLSEGQVFRIFTGAKVPENTTAVIMQEKTEVIDNQVKIADEIKDGKNIRRRGEEIATGQMVFNEGQELNPAAIGLLASLGIEHVSVYQKPSVSILTTGNELVKPGKPLNPGQIYESNGSTLEAVLKAYGFECQKNKHEKDDYESIRRIIEKLLSPSLSHQGEKSDVLLISGGISVGEYDFVKKALEENGVEELFYKVKQKPGKPLYFGRKGDQSVFALPGNPASALTCFYVYVLPLLQRIAGSANPGLPQVQVSLAHDYIMKSDRPTFMKAKFNSEVEILEGQSSSMLHSFSSANVLAFLEGPNEFKKGDLVKCYLM